MATDAEHAKHDNQTPPPKHHLSTGEIVTGLIAVVMAALTVLAGSQLKNHYPFPHNFHDKIDSPVLALELSASVSDLNEVLHTDDPGETKPNTDAGKAVDCLRTNTIEDFFFIPLYTSFLAAFAILFAAGPHRRPVAHRRIVITVVILVAVFDGAENIGILCALRASSLTYSTAQAISVPSHCKWSLFALALLFTAWILARSSGTLYSLATRRLLALAYGAAGVLMMIGLWMPHIIEVSTYLFAFLTIINIVGLLGPAMERLFFRARHPVYVDDFCNRKARRQADVAVFSSTPSGA
jgi:hypothetical protein